MVVILVRVLGTGSLSQRFLMSSKVFASYISDEAWSLLAPFCSNLFLISSLGPLLLQPWKVISVAQSHLSICMGVDACAESCNMLSRQQYVWEQGARSIWTALGKRFAGCSRTRCQDTLTRMAACLQKEDREPVMENLLLFDELSPEHARRTVAFTVHKICASSQENCKLSE